jgi:hypothetical protein
MVDTDLLIRASVYLGSGLIRYRDVEKRGPRGAAYEKVEANWDDAVNGFGVATTLFRNAGVPNGSWLPYRYLLLPPAIAVAKGHTLGQQWLAWAIVASLWRHYVGEVDTKLERDANLAARGDITRLLDHVRTRAKRTESVIPEEDDFIQNIVNDSGVHLALLLHFHLRNARSFPAGKLLSGADEPLEVHHIFPRAVLDAFQGGNEYIPDQLGNLTFLTRSDNEHLSDDKPDEYLSLVDRETRVLHLIPDDKELWSVNRYPDFRRQREIMMARAIRGMLADMTKSERGLSTEGRPIQLSLPGPKM